MIDLNWAVNGLGQCFVYDQNNPRRDILFCAFDSGFAASIRLEDVVIAILLIREKSDK